MIAVVTFAPVLMLAACQGDPFYESISGQAQEAAGFHMGEAHANNLEAMAASRRDLDRPRRETPADATRRDAVIAAYRNSGGTHASQSTQSTSTGTKP